MLEIQYPAIKLFMAHLPSHRDVHLGKRDLMPVTGTAKAEAQEIAMAGSHMNKKAKQKKKKIGVLTKDEKEKNTEKKMMETPSCMPGKRLWFLQLFAQALTLYVSKCAPQVEDSITWQLF